MNRTRVVIMGAAGRDFHDFNVVYRDDPAFEVVAFTATQIPGIAERTYPAELAGPLYPEASSARSWPAKPARIIVPYATDGVSDMLGRLLA